MYQLKQSALNRGDFRQLESAVAEKAVIDARRLHFKAGHIAYIRQFLESDSSDYDHFAHWIFEGSNFADDCNFSDCSFRLTAFDDCHFGDHVSFRGARFTRALFRRSSFGHDVCFERVDFGIRADFHSAHFGHRARFSHSRFQSTQFFAVNFGNEASFAGAHFANTARFHSTRFGPRANITEARFAGTVDFGGAYFDEKLQMVSAQFDRGSRFDGATFGARARLTNWRVAGDLNMRSAHFLGAVSLHNAYVEGNAIFSHASFDGSVDVGRLTARQSAYFTSASINGADRFGPLNADSALDLKGVIVRSACGFGLSAAFIDLSDARFLAPSRVTVGAGDLLMERVENDARLVLTKPQPIGVKMSAPRLLSVRGSDLNSVVLSGFDVRSLRFEGAEGIDGMRIESGTAFEHAPRGIRTHREVIAEEHAMRESASKANHGWNPASCRFSRELRLGRVGYTELARIYRSLRKAREDMRDAPGAADFYYGEMEMRRLEEREHLSAKQGIGPFALHAGTYLLLELYRVVGGYGVRPSRPFLLFIVAVIAAAVGVDCHDLIHQLVHGQGSDHPSLAAANFEQCVVFVLRSALLLPTSPQVIEATGAEWVQICARLLGPLLVGLFVFGIRARVHR